MQKNKPIINYLTDFLDHLEIEKRLSAKTQENYKRFLTKFFNWLKECKLDNLKPSALSPDHVRKYKVYLSRYIDPINKKPLKKSTQNYYLIALRSLLEFFAELDIPSLPSSKITLGKNSKDKEVRFLHLEQVEKLLLSPDITKESGLRDRAILETLFSTGLRVAELKNLNRDQIKLSRGADEIEVAIVGKGERIRSVYFSERAIIWLKKYLDKRSDIDDALFINYKPGIAKTNSPRRLTTKSIEEIVKKYVIQSGLPVMATPHTLRHSFATDLLSEGVDLRLVQEFLGHRNISTTQIYTHVTNKQLRDVHKRIHKSGRLKN